MKLKLHDTRRERSSTKDPIGEYKDFIELGKGQRKKMDQKKIKERN